MPAPYQFCYTIYNHLSVQIVQFVELSWHIFDNNFISINTVLSDYEKFDKVRKFGYVKFIFP